VGNKELQLTLGVRALTVDKLIIFLIGPRKFVFQFFFSGGSCSCQAEGLDDYRRDGKVEKCERGLLKNGKRRSSGGGSPPQEHRK